MLHLRSCIGLMALLSLIHGGCQDNRTAQDEVERSA